MTLEGEPCEKRTEDFWIAGEELDMKDLPYKRDREQRYRLLVAGKKVN